MSSELIFYEKRVFSERNIVEMKIWEVPKSKAFPEGVKYSFVFIHDNKRILGYDNEREKGHHKHYKGKEIPIKFKDPETLLLNFQKEVEELIKNHI